jgi:FtsP/CotA-like multicopper oxidase with cupredoxin domain
MLQITRRRFFATALLSSGLTFPLRSQETHYHSAPEDEMAHSSAEQSPDPIRHALQDKVLKLEGLDPMRYLTNFDFGTTTTVSGRTVREFTVIASETRIEIAPGIYFPAWTYNNSVPGPTLRCKEGDLLRIRLLNHSQAEHTIHFHGVHASSMDGVYEPVQPGKERLYEFIAEPSGLQFYHCHTVPVGLHMNRGLFGALIIDPKVPRPDAHELVMTLHGWDVDFDGKNELYAINGGANFYHHNPVSLAAGKPIRIYLTNALEYEPVETFHIHANFFHLFRTGARAVPDDYTDVVTLAQAERCILEFTYQTPGRYMFHSHRNWAAELGCMGTFQVHS